VHKLREWNWQNMANDARDALAIAVSQRNSLTAALETSSVPARYCAQVCTSERQWRNYFNGIVAIEELNEKIMGLYDWCGKIILLSEKLIACCGPSFGDFKVWAQKSGVWRVEFFVWLFFFVSLFCLLCFY